MNLSRVQKEFRFFLWYEGVEEEFIKYWSKERNTPCSDLEDFLNKIGSECWLDMAFTWTTTESGHNFWREKEDLWLTWLRSNTEYYGL